MILGVYVLLLISACLVSLSPTSIDAQSCGVTGDVPAQVRTGVAALCAEVTKGTWYKWGGGHGARPGPTDSGFDCSGLSRYYYSKATGRDPFGGTNANGQFISNSKEVAAKIASNQGIDALLPGDLVYFGTSNNKSHVGIYIGGGNMIEAQKTGTQIKVSPMKGRKNYGGALRMRYD